MKIMRQVKETKQILNGQLTYVILGGMNDVLEQVHEKVNKVVESKM